MYPDKILKLPVIIIIFLIIHAVSIKSSALIKHMR